MKLWKKCHMDTVYWGDEAPEEKAACQVRIGEGRIAISYEEEGHHVVYEGREDGGGHFRLVRLGGGGSATLHQFPEEDELEGFWQEGGYLGFWRVTLSD